MRLLLALQLCHLGVAFLTTRPEYRHASVGTLMLSMDDSQPSDYDSSDLPPVGKRVAVDFTDEDSQIRDALKRELLLLASVTNRGEFASKDELNIVIDLVTQLEVNERKSRRVAHWLETLHAHVFDNTGRLFVMLIGIESNFRSCLQLRRRMGSVFVVDTVVSS